MNYLSCSLDDIIEYAKDTNTVDVLKKIANKKVGGKPISFLQLKREYFLTVDASIVPVAKEKAPKMWEKIANL